MVEDVTRLVVLAATGIEEYQASLLRGMRPVLDAHNLSRLVYLDSEETEALSANFVQFLRRSGAVGLLTTQLCHQQHLEELVELAAELSLPTVVIGAEDDDLSCVRGDNITGMRALMGHLLDECGVRRPVLVRGWAFQQDSAEREAVFREELAARGIPVDEELVIEGRFVSDIAHRALRTLLRRRRDFDAVVACNDPAAHGCITALTEAGLEVPDDVLVTGFDNNQDTLHWPGLTTVDQSLAEQGSTAAELLVAQLEGRSARPTVCVPSRLVVRDSTAVESRTEHEQLNAALQMVTSARTRIANRDTSANFTRTTLTCRTLDDVLETLVSSLEWFKLRRCFVAIRADLCGALQDLPTSLFTDTTGSPDGQPASASTVRLLLDYRDGVPHPPPPDPYPAHLLLPDSLRGQLTEGMLVVSTLVVGQREYGHLLTERHDAALATYATLHVDLARALDTVFSRRALEAHASNLEAVVDRRTEELEHRTEELARRTRDLQAEVITRMRAEQQLQVANSELRQTAMRDGLTGIANRAAFELHLAHHWETLTAAGGPLTMLLVDVDRFKNYNDNYGHIAGDDTLRAVADCLRRSACRPDDLVARYGGEEFAAVLPQGNANAGLTVAMRFQTLLAEQALPHAASDIAPVVTASVGIAVVHPARRPEPTDLVAAADRALYRAKQLGRNRAVLVEDDETATDVATGPQHRAPRPEHPAPRHPAAEPEHNGPQSV